MNPRRSVLFLCVGNSCRSQMAEAIVNARLSEEWHARSAGSAPEGYIHPKAITALKEIGIDHEGESKSIETLRQENFDVVVTLCDAEAESCPIWLGAGQQFHQPFPDPFRAVGSESEIMSSYRQVLSEIETEIPTLLTKIN